MGNKIISSLGILLIFIMTPVSLDWFGKSSRTYKEKKEIAVINEPNQAFLQWQKNNLKGRVLLHFSKNTNSKMHEKGVAEPLTDKSYIFYAIKGGHVRKIYNIIPTDEWQKKEEIIKNKNTVQHGFYFSAKIIGVPLLFLQFKDIDKIIEKEKVIINISGDEWDESEVSGIISFLNDGLFDFDLITISGRYSERIQREVSLNGRK